MSSGEEMEVWRGYSDVVWQADARIELLFNRFLSENKEVQVSSRHRLQE
jgi:hypothetical protein